MDAQVSGSSSTNRMGMAAIAFPPSCEVLATIEPPGSALEHFNATAPGEPLKELSVHFRRAAPVRAPNGREWLGPDNHVARIDPTHWDPRLGASKSVPL